MNNDLTVTRIIGSNITYASGVEMWHHLQTVLLLDKLFISIGLTITIELNGWDTIFTISEDKKGIYSSTVFLINQSINVIYKAYYNSNSGSLCLYGNSLPVGSYFVLS